MISNKKNICLAFLFTITTFNSYNMESQYKKFKKTVRNILGTTQRQQPNVIQNELRVFTLFTELPKDVQIYITNLLILYNIAGSITDATSTVNSLAMVNKEFNIAINDDKFCLQLIKYLAKKFNLADQEVSKMLHFEEANNRTKLQNKLYELCRSFYPEQLPYNVSLLVELGVDLEFTYEVYGNILTPLSIACNVNNGILKQLCTINNENKNKLFNINRRNEDGETVLFLCIQDDLTDNSKILLDAGADPEIPNNRGTTPLQIAETNGNEELIELIKKAIEAKYSKK